MKNPVVIIVGGSSVGKTQLALDFAYNCVDPRIICGDQYQLLEGWPIASGAAEATSNEFKLYGYGLCPGGLPPMNKEQFWDATSKFITTFPSKATPIIEGLSVEYLSTAPNKIDGRKVLIFGLRTNSVTEQHMRERLEDAIESGLFEEVTKSLEKYGSDCWMAQNSMVVKAVSQYCGQINDFVDEIVPKALKIASLDKENILLKDTRIVWVSGLSNLQNILEQ